MWLRCWGPRVRHTEGSCGLSGVGHSSLEGDRGRPVTRLGGAGVTSQRCTALLLLTPRFLHAAQCQLPGGLWRPGTGLDQEQRGPEEQKWAPGGNPLRRPDPVPARGLLLLQVTSLLGK